ncbi:HBL393Cp [Eremothecium sinecaudum]|uniref:HBL393Cp n=1 Tax=Eremothecium sinecaudum TaxID=45286 RepID=A0A120K0M9_9SACH|nr:HBL393Cp [Eremothecium sinecaudum]AMD18509.1 HBL393Cp [Eremothecium sinecaudum]
MIMGKDYKIECKSIAVFEYLSKRICANEEFLYIKHEKYHTGNGLAAILSRPKSVKFSTLKERLINESEFELPLHKLVLLLHGDRSHKNSFYQPLLADKLSTMGYYVLRIDFRGLGDSEDNADEKKGRTIQQDVEDILSVYEFLESSACERLIGHQLTLDTIVAHSRGVVSMFEFAKTQFVPNLINCCGRFESSGLLLKDEFQQPNWKADGGITCKAPRYGKIKEIWIPAAETISAATVDTLSFASIDEWSFVMSVYGTADSIIPITAASEYANLFRGRHKLELLPGVTHNFFGLADDKNELQLPLKDGKVCYYPVLVDKIGSHLSKDNQLQRFFKASELIKSKVPPVCLPRWPLPYEYSNISNFRDIGGYKTASGHQVKSAIMYRCANPCDAPPEVIEYMKSDLKISRIFDLRSTKEAINNGIISGLPVENLSFIKDHNMSAEDLAVHYQGLFISSYNFPQVYSSILESSHQNIRRFFQTIVNGEVNKDHTIVFHCTAGKDRTGILSMLILGVLGVPADIIARDYEFTTIGLRTEKKLLALTKQRADGLRHLVDPTGSSLIEEYNLTPEKMKENVLSSTYEAMRIFIDRFLDTYGSFDDYFINTLKFTSEDVSKIRNLLLE